MMRIIRLLSLLLFVAVLSLAGCQGRLSSIGAIESGAAPRVTTTNEDADTDQGLVQLSLGVSGFAEIANQYQSASTGFEVYLVDAKMKPRRVYSGELSVGDFLNGKTFNAVLIPVGIYKEVLVTCSIISFRCELGTSLAVDQGRTMQFKLLLNLDLVDRLAKLPPEEQKRLTLADIRSLFLASAGG